MDPQKGPFFFASMEKIDFLIFCHCLNFFVFLLGDILKIEIKKLKYHLTFFKKNKNVKKGCLFESLNIVLRLGC